jgi:hypothetical protein
MLDGYIICNAIRQNEICIVCLLKGASKSVRDTAVQSKICDVLA